jgi:methylmalonyl-CoA mutase cobalamin-binding domain/chain
MEEIIIRLHDLFLSADKIAALELIEEWAKENSFEEALTKLVEPALRKFGQKWARQDDVNLAQGYIAAKISEEVLLRIAEERKENGVTSQIQGIAVVGNIEDDYHALGRKMIRNFLQSSGWEVHDLGNDVLAEEFVDKAVEVNASVIGVSAMMYTNAKNMIKVREELDKRGLSGKIMFAVGGAIFNMRPELVKEVGADGTALNAMKSIDLFNELNKRSSLNHE